MIRPAKLDDAVQICGIYNYYVKDTVITFETALVSETEMKQRILQVQKDYAWLVHESNGTVNGFAYASRWKDRCSYRYTVESTVYVTCGNQRKGIGRALYQELFARLNQRDIHAVVAGIAIPNSASQALHESLGFQKVAHFRQVGYKFGQWIDVGYWQKLLSC